MLRFGSALIVVQVRDSGFASITFNHELKVGYSRRSLATTNSKNWHHKPVWLFLSITCDHELKELAPQGVLRRNKNGTFCGQGLGTFCDVLWPGTSCNGSFCGHESHKNRCGPAPCILLLKLCGPVHVWFTSDRNCGHARKLRRTFNGCIARACPVQPIEAP